MTKEQMICDLLSAGAKYVGDVDAEKFLLFDTADIPHDKKRALCMRYPGLFPGRWIAYPILQKT